MPIDTPEDLAKHTPFLSPEQAQGLARDMEQVMLHFRRKADCQLLNRQALAPGLFKGRHLNERVIPRMTVLATRTRSLVKTTPWQIVQQDHAVLQMLALESRLVEAWALRKHQTTAWREWRHVHYGTRDAGATPAEAILLLNGVKSQDRVMIDLEQAVEMLRAALRLWQSDAGAERNAFSDVIPLLPRGVRRHPAFRTALKRFGPRERAAA